MAVKVEDLAARTIDYRLNILGIRVWEHSCQLVAKAGGDWGTIGPRCDLPVQVPRNAEELKAAAAEPLRLTAYQYCAECPESGLAEVLDQTRDFSAELQASSAAAGLKGPLSEGNRALLRELETRESVLVRERLAQPFQEAEPRADRELSDQQAWDAATEHDEFGKTAAALGHEQLVKDMWLDKKQQEDARRFGLSKSLADLHKGENETHAREFDEERGRHAREFLEQRKLAEELERKEPGLEKDKGQGFSQ